MKKILAFALVICSLMLTLFLASCAVGSDGAGDDKNSATPLGNELAAVSSAAHLNTELSTELAFTFRIPAEEYDSFISDVYEPQWTAYTGKVTGDAKITEENGTYSVVTELERQTVNGIEYHCFDVSTGSIFVEDYFTSYGATLTVGYKVGGEARTVSFNAIPCTVYDVAFREYTDRSYVESEKYSYAQADGTYSPCASLGRHRSILASAITVYVSDSGVRYAYNNEHYTSPYVCEYFDGVLSIRTLSGEDINPSILKYLVVNGKREYFEIYDGIIRIVV
ncbi:MAG: hypothetical protein IJX38_05155 [Clostridia bacterium]|nr:hypothetical protein [Clostridia bacterium]